jgi:hypothetical protein
LILTGCDKGGQSDKPIELLQTTIHDLQTTLTEKEQEIEKLKVEVTEKEPVQTELEKTLHEYPWLRKLNPNTKWDKVVIYRYEGDPAMATVEDPLFLESIGWLLHPKSVGVHSYPSGYQTDIAPYIYEFYEGKQKYTIHVVDRGVIEAGRNELYLEVEKDIHQLGNAFMPKRPFIKHDGLIAKMAASGAVKRGEQYVSLSSFRVQSRIASLMDGTPLKNKPDPLGEKVERFTFYYYGLELVMDIYKDHVFLTGDGAEQWYYYKDAEDALTVEAG